MYAIFGYVKIQFKRIAHAYTMKCEWCKKTVAFVDCKWCKKNLCTSCIQLEIHKCPELEAKKNQDRAVLVTKLPRVTGTKLVRF